MKAFNPDIVSNKLTHIQQRLLRLHKFKGITAEQYAVSTDAQDIVERNLEIIIQAAADVNRYLLSRLTDGDQAGLGSVTNAESFLGLANAEILPQDLAETLAESGKFRNVLAHLYDEISPEKVVAAIGAALQYYPDYLYAIQSYLDSILEDDQQGYFW